ncbi:ComF family protein [Legionella feeleii]|uniref:Competence protein ComF n=1 Tax=Legionella feeleii TaxID=453 RepID=A0A0W0TL12_9GAMM|nr:ComF family protein [Legionella feeleii]KTC96302.1 competence protein ComF [Legionella feeleii]SPX62582.1 competence protein ComF [Legionella feeleii]
MRQKITSIAQLLRLPSVCVLCQQYHRDPFAVCQPCNDLFKQITHACYFCALPLPDAKFLVCGVCSQKKPGFDHTITRYYFEEPLRTLIHEFKYRDAFYLRTFLTKLMLDALPEKTTSTQCLVPVPLHPRRLQQRGFNQAAELAKLLAKQLKIPCELNLCKKIIHTIPQANLDSQRRRKNLHQAFQVKINSYNHITLIDDLLTTGSTVNELARLFKQQGVTRVDVWCCARTSSS